MVGIELKEKGAKEHYYVYNYKCIFTKKKNQSLYRGKKSCKTTKLGLLDPSVAWLARALEFAIDLKWLQFHFDQLIDHKGFFTIDQA